MYILYRCKDAIVGLVLAETDTNGHIPFARRKYIHANGQMFRFNPDCEAEKLTARFPAAPAGALISSWSERR